MVAVIEVPKLVWRNRFPTPGAEALTLADEATDAAS